MLTIPYFHANTLRLEQLVHLIVANCEGKEKPGHRQYKRWLNEYLRGITHLEDPAEDVFIVNLETSEGNRRLFRGIWEAPDYFLQVAMDTLAKGRAPQQCKGLLHSAYAILRLSEAVAERLGLERWCSEESKPQSTMRIAPVTGISEHALAVTFSVEDLAMYQIDKKSLAPFIFDYEGRQSLSVENIGHSSLERRPLLDFGDTLVFALPSAVSPAIRRYLVEELDQLGLLGAFEQVLGTHQAQQIEKNVFWEIRDKCESIYVSPSDNGPIPSMHAWLLKYDINKYLHVVLLHDRLDLLKEEGFASFLQYPESVKKGLEKYVSQIAGRCQSESDFSDGMTLFVFGGLGRGFVLDFKACPDHWRFSSIRVSDLLILALNSDSPFERYLKFIKQKDWAKAEGVFFQSMDGDFNHYCFWVETNCQLVSRNLPVRHGAMIALECDCSYSFRKKHRELADAHVAQTVSGEWVPLCQDRCRVL